MTKDRKKAEARSLRELLAEQFPEREDLMFPWLRQGESAMIWAETGIGKTMLTMTLALMVAGGGSALGWSSDKPRKVLIVDGEMAREDLQARAEMLMDTIEGIDRDAAAENLAIMARTWQAADTEFPDLHGEPWGQELIVETAKRRGAELIVLDNFSTLASVEDENDAASMGPTLIFLMRLKAERIGCILVHHSGKTGATYRGSSRLATTFEVIIGLKRLDESGSVTGAAFTIEWTKFRGTPHPEVRSKDVRLIAGPDGVAQWSAEAAAKDKLHEVVEAIRSCQFRDQRVVAEALGISAGEMSKRKTAAIAQGLITGAEVALCFAEAESGTEALDF